MGLIGRHFGRLFDAGGRENRQPFWLWVLAVVIAAMVIDIIAMIPISASIFESMAPLANGDQAYLNQHPEIAQQAMMKAFVPMMRDLIGLSSGVTAVAVVLLAAAVVRRLHDGGRSGWWGLPPLLLQLATMGSYMAVFPRFLTIFSVVRPGMTPDQMNAAMAPMMQSTAWVSLLGMVNLLALVVLVVFLALPGTAGPNRYGDDPIERERGLSSWRRPPTSHP